MSVVRVHEIDHVTFVVHDLDATRHFYTEILGMEEVPRPAFPFPGAWFQAGPTQIHVNLASPDAGLPGVTTTGGTQPSRGFHVAFRVDDAHEAAQRIRDAGIEIVAGPWNRPDGPVQFYFRDPDGHLIELFSDLDSRA